MRIHKLAPFVLLAACGSSAKTRPAGTPVPTAADDPSCPVSVAGTSVTVEDTAGGAALVFVTTGEHAKASTEEIVVASTADVGKLQSELRMHAQHLASGTCEMGAH